MDETCLSSINHVIVCIARAESQQKNLIPVNQPIFSFLSMPLSTNHISRHHRICQLLMPPPDLLLYNACLHFLAIIVHWLLIYCDPTTSFFQTRHSDSSCYSFITNSITPKLQNTCYIDHFDYFNRARSHV